MGPSRLIEIYTEELPPAFQWHPEDDFKRGTTEFFVETAENLQRLGHDVVVYYDGPPAHCRGISYLPRGYVSGSDVVLSCNSKAPVRGSRNVYWTNRYHDQAKDYADFDAIICISKFHQSRLGDGKVFVVGHGCHPDQLIPGRKIPGQCLYSSSPDRGLPFLEGIWPAVHAATGAKLIATGYSDLPEEEVNRLYRESQFWLHPCTGVELFCISGLKAQAASCIPVFIPRMALKETIKWGIVTNEKCFKDDLIRAIKKPPTPKRIQIPTWLEVTEKIEKLLTA